MATTTHGLASPCLISPHSGLGMKHENTTNAFLRAQEVWGDQQGTMD